MAFPGCPLTVCKLLCVKRWNDGIVQLQWIQKGALIRQAAPWAWCCGYSYTTELSLELCLLLFFFFSPAEFQYFLSQLQQFLQSREGALPTTLATSTLILNSLFFLVVMSSGIFGVVYIGNLHTGCKKENAVLCLNFVFGCPLFIFLSLYAPLEPCDVLPWAFHFSRSTQAGVVVPVHSKGLAGFRLPLYISTSDKTSYLWDLKLFLNKCACVSPVFICFMVVQKLEKKKNKLIIGFL